MGLPGQRRALNVRAIGSTNPPLYCAIDRISKHAVLRMSLHYLPWYSRAASRATRTLASVQRSPEPMAGPAPRITALRTGVCHPPTTHHHRHLLTPANLNGAAAPRRRSNRTAPNMRVSICSGGNVGPDEHGFGGHNMTSTTRPPHACGCQQSCRARCRPTSPKSVPSLT